MEITVMTEKNNTQKQQEKRAFSRFLVIWSGEFLSGIGTGLTAFTLAAYAFRQTGLATSAAMIVLSTFLPAFLLRPIGGVLADRMDRRLLMIFGNLGSALGIVLILLLMTVNNHGLWVIYPGAALSSVFVAFHNPAYKASVSDFLPRELYEKASGLLQLSGAAPLLLAPFIAGFLMSLIDIRFILLIDILTFLFSDVVILFKENVKEKSESKESHFIKEMNEGFKTIVESRGILILTSVVSLILFYVGLLQALLAPMVLSFTDTAALGAAQSICAVGMLLSSLLIVGFGGRRRYVPVLSIALGLMGLFFSFIGMRESIRMIIIPGFLFFFTLPFINSSIEVLIRQNISNEKQGRAWSLISFITYFGAIIAYAIAGFLADKIFNPLFMPGGVLAVSPGNIFGVGPGRGIAFIFFISGIIVIFLSIIIYRSKSIRQLDLNREAERLLKERFTHKICQGG
jgi:MFS family permease